MSPILVDRFSTIGAVIVRQLGVIGEFFDGLLQQAPHVIVVGDTCWSCVVQLLRSDLSIEVRQEKTERAGDISVWLIEEFVENIIPHARAHAQILDLVVNERIRRYGTVHVFRSHSNPASIL